MIFSIFLIFFGVPNFALTTVLCNISCYNLYAVNFVRIELQSSELCEVDVSSRVLEFSVNRPPLRRTYSSRKMAVFKLLLIRNEE